MDFQACVGARQVEEACAVSVADTHIFHGRTFGPRRKIGSLGSRDADNTCRCAEEKTHCELHGETSS